MSQVRLAADAYLVCLHHALTTEKEEVMGLLVGEFSKVKCVCCLQMKFTNKKVLRVIIEKGVFDSNHVFHQGFTS